MWTCEYGCGIEEGEMNVNLRKIMGLFWSTLWIGAGAGLLVGLLMALGDAEFRSLKALEIGYNLLVMALAGMMFSILSQMVFFAYMTINYIARDMFRKPTTWVLVQLFFIVTVPFELMFFVWNGSIWTFVIGAGMILLASLAVAYWKIKLTKPSAFVPTLFFMFVATLLETAIALKVDNLDAAILMVVPLLACNAWQILQLHKLVRKDEEPIAVS
jgi:KinB signaling pathway activation protein